MKKSSRMDFLTLKNITPLHIVLAVSIDLVLIYIYILLYGAFCTVFSEEYIDYDIIEDDASLIIDVDEYN